MHLLGMTLNDEKPELPHPVAGTDWQSDGTGRDELRSGELNHNLAAAAVLLNTAMASTGVLFVTTRSTLVTLIAAMLAAIIVGIMVWRGR